jgi:hypothetical protein
MIKIKREIVKGFWKILPKTVRMNIYQHVFHIPLQRDLDHRVLKRDGEKWMDILVKTICSQEQEHL